MECTTKTPAELYDEEIPKALKNASRKLCGKLIKHAVLNPEDKRAAIYNAFDRNPEDKKMPYDDFLKAYGLKGVHISKNEFDESRRVHTLAEGVADLSRRQALRGMPVTVAAEVAAVRDAIYGLDSDYEDCIRDKKSERNAKKLKDFLGALFDRIKGGESIPLSEMREIKKKISNLYDKASVYKKIEDDARKAGSEIDDEIANTELLGIVTPITAEEIEEESKLGEVAHKNYLDSQDA